MNSDFPTFVKGVMAPRVGKAAKIISMLVKTHFAAHRVLLTKEQFIVLLCLEEGSKNQSFLAIITERNKGSLTRLIQSLEKKGFVERNASAKDNRVNQVEMTDQGRWALEHAKPIMKNVFAILQEGIEENEMQVATQVLDKMQENAILEIEKLEEAKK